MSSELIKHAFIAGEFSPALFGRTDLTKYDLGMALTKNWFVDYRGGLSTRPGFDFVDHLQNDQFQHRLAEFQFSPEQNDTYLVVFSADTVTFVQDGAYVLESAKAITAAPILSPLTLTCPAHGYSDGDWVKIEGAFGFTDINGHTYDVNVVDSNNFQLRVPGTLAAVDRTGETYVGGGSAYRVHTIASPYSGEELAALGIEQVRNLLRLTHVNHPICNLVRNDHADWEIVEEPLDVTSFDTWNLAGTPSTSGDMSVVYAVSAVLLDGAESPPSYPLLVDSAVNFTVTEGAISLTWDAQSGAKEYIVYRSQIVSAGDGASAGMQLGFLGRTKSNRFVDSNITPDFTKGPYENYNPFAPGGITQVEIDDPDSGYDFIAPLVATGPGTGYRGYATVQTDGSLGTVVTLDSGTGYDDTTVITAPGGSATFTYVVGAATGTYPAISATFQQRQLYAASYAAPLNIWASQPRRFSNFSGSAFVIDTDSYEFEIDSAQVAPLRHLFSMRGGLVLMSQTGIWQLTGGSQQAVTPSNALADPQTYNGVAAVRPLKVATDILYAEGKGYGVRLLSYNEYSKVYSGEDKAVLSNHLFGEGRSIYNWCFAENPYKVVWATRTDGRLLAFTVVKEQDVFAWTWGQTKGLFREMIAINESGIDRVYATVQRLVGDRWCKYLERMARRDFAHIEEARCADSALSNTLSVQSVTIHSISAEFSVGSQRFVDIVFSIPTTGRVGYIVRAAGGIFEITAHLSSNLARCLVRASATKLIPEDPELRPLPVAAGEWTLDAPRTVFYGFRHLIGESVSLLADGNELPPQVVEAPGKVTLTAPASLLYGGLAYECVAQTLPPTVPSEPIEAKRKRVVKIAARLQESRGLEYGRTLDNLYEARERTDEAWGAPTRPQTGFQVVALDTAWEEDAQIYLVQRRPLPATILGLVPDLEVGDDND